MVETFFRIISKRTLRICLIIFLFKILLVKVFLGESFIVLLKKNISSDFLDFKNIF